MVVVVMLVVDGEINNNLAGRIHFPERPICACVHLLLTGISETARCAVLIIVKGTKPLRWFIPLKP